MRLFRSPSEGAVLKRTVLPGGLRVVTEAIPGVRSVAFGVWVGVGSRDESEAQAGASHYLEHLLFKGTPSRSALEIAAQIEAVGGESNAFTDKEYTCFYARVLDEDLPLAIDVTCDMVTSSLVRAADVEAERSVVLEEIAMRDDDPGDVVHELFAEALYGSHPLGRPVIGSVASIGGLSRDTINDFYRARYRPQTMVVAAAGGLRHEDVVRRVQAAFSDHVDAEATPMPLRAGDRPVDTQARALVHRRRTEQANVLLGCPALPRGDTRRWALAVLLGALGGGQSSRLFQSIREEHGLAYSVYAFSTAHADTGLMGVYAGCSPKKVDDVLGLVRDALDLAAMKGLSDAEVARAKGQLRGETVLGLEDTGSRMTRIGKSELMRGEVLTVEEVLARIDAVTPDDVRAVAAEVLSRPRSLAVVGPFRRDFADVVA